MVTATIAALCAAALFAVSSALQHRSATDVPKLGSLGRTELARFAWRSVRHSAWLIGTAADALGLALHAVALHAGPLTLVQPLLVSGVIFALPLRRLLDRGRPRLRELVFAALLAGGLATFLVVSTPASAVTAAADRMPAVVSVTALTLTTLLLIWLGRRTNGAGAALSLGLATGLTFAASAALIKTTTETLTHRPVAVLTTWPLYGLILVGVLGLLLNQMAFQAGPLGASLPAMVTSDPLVSVVIGVAVYDESLRTGRWAVTAEVLGLAAVVVAAVALSRSQHRSDPVPSPPRPDR